MGRHRMPTRPRHAVPRSGRVRVLAPASLAASVLVALPVGVGGPGVAVAAQDEPPPALVDSAGTALSSATGTDDNEPRETRTGDAGADDAGADDAGADDAGADDAGADDAGADDAGADDAGAGTPVDEPTAPATAEDLAGLAGLPGGTELPADTGAAGTGATRVVLNEKNGSGVAGKARVDAETVEATATGMDPGARYVSFFYGATSSATSNNPCILDGTNPFPADQTVGEWEVDENGDGTLVAANPLGERYLMQAGTMSIRKVEHDFSSATALPVNPLSYSLVACGEVQRIDTLDPVTGVVPKLPAFPSVAPLS